MSETDSFIEEVTEEVRRDKLFVQMRKYGWIAGVVIVSIVGGAAYNEWRKSAEASAAQKLGNAITLALNLAVPADRAAALSEIATDKAGTTQFLTLIQAAELAETEDMAAALSLYDAIIADSDTPLIYKNLAQLKSVMMRGSDQNRDQRMAVLDQLAEPGNAFRVIAMEQKALALIQYGNNDEAIALLGQVLNEPQATQALIQRAQQVIVALGGTLSADGSQLVETE